jgi:hypothetical protein
MNKEIKKKATKDLARKLRAKKEDAAIGTQETSETTKTEESLKKKSKKRVVEFNSPNSTGFEEKALKAKRAPKKLILGNVIN